MIAALDLISRLRLPDQRPFGEAMAGYQRHDFEAMLAADAPPNVWVSRPRGGSKTTDVAALAIVDLLHAPDRSTSFAVAADADQARLLRHAIETWYVASPELHGRLRPATGSRRQCRDQSQPPSPCFRCAIRSRPLTVAAVLR